MSDNPHSKDLIGITKNAASGLLEADSFCLHGKVLSSFLTKKSGGAVCFSRWHRCRPAPFGAYAGVRETCLFTKTAEAVNCCSKRRNCTDHTQVPVREPAAVVFPARKPLLTHPSLEKILELQNCLDEASELPRIFCANEPNPPCIQYRYSKELSYSLLRSSGTDSDPVLKMSFRVTAYNSCKWSREEVVINMIGSMEMQHFLSNEPKIDCGNCRAAISKRRNPKQCRKLRSQSV